jgi:hypothetical protein
MVLNHALRECDVIGILLYNQCPKPKVNACAGR